ncbi:ice-binding family protein [Petrocella sp. FN5]|uniref:ice-binding family protein n=1 Tax=Petrocella sp. FN5 TaxID=3032002 RepID=UPI0023D984CB|nr:ice-binding family protein [Petrocella sp. FN5]MDF1618430.1 ice-binding family protein [Petrocella sp. FN5]
MKMSFSKSLTVFLCLLMVFTITTPVLGAVSSKDYESNWAKETIQSALSSGIADGYPDGTFKPNNPVTRAEFISLVNNIFGFTNAATTNYTDVSTTDWYAPAIGKAFAAGYISGYPDGSMKPDAHISRQEVASIISRLKSLSATSDTPDFTDGSSIATWSKQAIIAIDEAKIMVGYPNGSFKPLAQTTRAEALVAITRAFNYNVISEPIAVYSIDVKENTMTLMAGGLTGIIALEITPDNATNQNVNWTSSDSSVATVEDGIVTPIAEGTALIRVTSDEDLTKTATTTVTVVKSTTPTEPTEPLGKTVDLGMAGDFVILSKTGISSVPNSVITGDIGVSPIADTAITGFSLTLDATNQFSISDQVTGRVYAATYTSPTPSNLTTAISDMETAYTDAAGRAVNFTELHSGDLSGKTLVPGVYKWGTGVLINSEVTLDGGPNDIWILQIGEGMTQANGTRITLSGGAQAKNVFWQVAESVSIGTGSHFEGIILSKTNITMGTNASINGRLLAQTAVTLDTSTVVAP